MTSLVLTFVGDDRPGLVNAISEKVAGTAGPGSRAVRCGSRANSPALCWFGFRTKTSSHSNRRWRSSRLQACASRSSVARRRRPKNRARLVTLEIVGKERPGIVRDVTQALTGLGVNIEEFMSSLEGEPFTGAVMFRATARLDVPDGLKLDELRKALERLAAEIMVDLSVGDGEPGAGA